MFSFCQFAGHLNSILLRDCLWTLFYFLLRNLFKICTYTLLKIERWLVYKRYTHTTYIIWTKWNLLYVPWQNILYCFKCDRSVCSARRNPHLWKLAPSFNCVHIDIVRFSRYAQHIRVICRACPRIALDISSFIVYIFYRFW